MLNKKRSLIYFNKYFIQVIEAHIGELSGLHIEVVSIYLNKLLCSYD